MDLFFVVALLIAAFLPSIDCQSIPRRGTVRLVRGSSSVVQSLSVSSGRVQIYINNRWGHICDDFDFTLSEATVICHQLGFSSASSFSTARIDGFGYDSSFSYALDNVDCTVNTYLVILQCRHSTVISSGCLVNRDEVSVSCFTTRIWSSPYNGQIRLQDATYTNQGLVEVYCNGQWGTICDDGFSITDGNTVCKQLGYTGAAAEDSLSLVGSSSQPIWFTFVPCSSTDSCLRDCQLCRSSRITSCSHIEDITVECEYTSFGSSSNQINTCNFGTSTATNPTSITIPPIASSSVTGIIVGAVILGLVCTLLPILIPVCICCCLGIGICGATRNRGPTTRLVTTAAPPPTTAVVTTTQTTSAAYPTQQPTSYPTQPPPPAYAAQPPAAYPAQPPTAYPAQPPTAYPAQPPAAYPTQPPTAYPPKGAYPPQGAYPPPDGGYPPQPYPSTAEPPPYGGAAYPPY